ncbi:MAG: HlyD family secretion protein [Gemmatimonadaceae bacterium]|nr:HlyD family secretion protein [Gemmatimonadaceae bacterium]
MAETSRSFNIRLLIPLALLTALGVWGYQRWSFSRVYESTDNAQVDGHIVPVVAKVGGYVHRVAVDENTHVGAAGTIVQLDSSEYLVRLAQADAELAAALATSGDRAREGQASAQVRTAASQRDVGDAQVIAVRATVTKAAADLARAKELVGKQIISRAQLDAAQSAYDAATATLTATERQVAAATSGIANAQAGVRVAEARLAVARAARENAALQLSYTTIAAPVSGTVSRKQVEVGQLVQPGQTLMSVVSDSGMFVTANFKETQLARIRVGQRVTLEVDAYGDAAEGEIASIASATGAKFSLLPPDNATGNFTKVVQRVPVRIRITKTLGADRPLRPGMSVVANVRVDGVSAAPATASTTHTGS